MKKEILNNIKVKLQKVKPINFLFLFIAGIINGCGVTLFLYPVHLYDSGISGLSMFLSQITPSYLSISLFLLLLNIPIFIFGLKKQGIVFTIYSIFSVIIYSLTTFFIMNIFKINVDGASPIAGTDLLLCGIFGGIISGIGSGLVIRFGGAIDGIDVLSVIFAKKLNLSLGTFVMIFNVILYIICGLWYGEWKLPLYSIITYYIGSKTVDFIVDGIDKSKSAMIVTNKAAEINEALTLNFESSGTFVDCVGGYSKENKKIIYFIVNQFQINKLKTIVKEVDPNAYISLTDVSDIIKKK